LHCDSKGKMAMSVMCRTRIVEIQALCVLVKDGISQVGVARKIV